MMHKQPLKYIIQLILFNTLFLLLLGGVGAAGAGVYQQDPGANGIVSVEAEHFNNDVAQGGHSWVAVTPSGFSGTGAMAASPNNGTNNDTGYVSNSPRLDFQVNFTRTGTHYVWIRGRAGTVTDDSLHVGLDGNAIASSDRITGIHTTSWAWSAKTIDGPVATINVTNPGVHTINIWMREDGAVVDKLLLTTNASYIPSGTGVPESPGDTTNSDTAIPSVPSGLSGTALDTSRINLSWSASTDQGGSGLAGYWVYRDGVKIGTTSAPNYSDTALSAVTLYTYTVEAYDNAGNVSNQSSPVSVTTKAPSSGGGTTPVTSGVYQQDAGANGIVSVEAEHFDTKSSQGGHSWTSIAPAGSSGSGAMQASPNNGTYNNTGYVSNSPRLDFPINFTRTGKHYVWIRGRAGTVTDDSLHVGLDGNAIASSDRITGIHTTSWAWSAKTIDGPVATINVTNPGVHTINIWMREDGAVVDKLLLTTNASYIPSGTGAPESPSDTTAQESPTDTTASDTAIPSVPSGLSGTALDTSRIDLSWSASTDQGGSGLAGYWVYRDGVKIGTTSAPNYLDTVLSAVTLYTYTVEAYDNAGNASNQSNPVSVTTKAPSSGAATTPVTSGVYQQDAGANGIVSVEAEHFDTKSSQGGHSWTSIALAGSSGSGAMEAALNNGANNNTGYVSNSPRLDFPINFTRTGIHYVWIRAHTASGDDSVHVGLDGAAVSSSDRISGFALGSWSWSKQTMDGPVATVNITTTGIHTLNLWMREDGFVVDKLLLTTKASYIPSGTGVTESPTDASGTSGATVGSATLSWIPPTTKADGTALTNLAGYTIHYGNSSGNYTTTIDVNSPGIRSYVVQNLSSGTFYFAMTANDTAGNSSAFSNEASKVVNN